MGEDAVLSKADIFDGDQVDDIGGTGEQMGGGDLENATIGDIHVIAGVNVAADGASKNDDDVETEK